jgi:hypothetical protein
MDEKLKVASHSKKPVSGSVKAMSAGNTFLPLKLTLTGSF